MEVRRQTRQALRREPEDRVGALVTRVRWLTTQTPERPIEIAL
jgi:hypothetical protein